MCHTALHLSGAVPALMYVVLAKCNVYIRLRQLWSISVNNMIFSCRIKGTKLNAKTLTIKCVTIWARSFEMGGEHAHSLLVPDNTHYESPGIYIDYSYYFCTCTRRSDLHPFCTLTRQCVIHVNSIESTLRPTLRKPDLNDSSKHYQTIVSRKASSLPPFYIY